MCPRLQLRGHCRALDGGRNTNAGMLGRAPRGTAVRKCAGTLGMYQRKRNEARPAHVGAPSACNSAINRAKSAKGGEPPIPRTCLHAFARLVISYNTMRRRATDRTTSHELQRTGRLAKTCPVVYARAHLAVRPCPQSKEPSPAIGFANFFCSYAPMTPSGVWPTAACSRRLSGDLAAA